MRIWHVDTEPGIPSVNGVTTTMWLLAGTQARLGHEVTLFLHGEWEGTAAAQADAYGLSLARSGRRWRHVRPSVRPSARRPAEMVHFHSVFVPAHASAAFLLRRRGTPYLITPHGGLSPTSLERRTATKVLYSALVERRRLSAAAALTAVSAAELDQIRRFLPRYRGVLRHIDNPVDPAALHGPHWAGSPPEPRVVTLGRFDVRHKGLDTLVELARHLPSARFEIFGRAEGDQAGQLRRLMDRAPGNVAARSPVFGEEKAEVLRTATMYIQLSRWEGFPVSLAESMAAGLPVAAARRLPMAALLEEHDLGLVLDPDPATAARDLEAALADHGRLRTWSERGAAYAAERFQPRSVAERYLDLYEELAAAPA